MAKETRDEDVGLPLDFRVAGTGYDRRYSTIRRYAARQSEVRLVPEPNNEFDRNAIAVRMLWRTETGSEIWDQIGYVPSELAPVVGPLISGGEWAIERAFIKKLDASPDLDAPRVTVRIEGTDLRRGKEKARAAAPKA